jgi:hypothetical protein
MWADDYIERNITSSDVEFLEGEDFNEESDVSKKIKDKPESPRASINNTLATPDLPGLGNKADQLPTADHDDDIYMDDVMSVLNKPLTWNLLYRAHCSPTNNPQSESTAVKRKDVGHPQLRYVET